MSDAGSVLGRAGVREGQPFVLAADGSYDVALNRFLRELPSWGVRSPRSVDAYARDLLVFCRFLHDSRGGKTIWRADSVDLRAFKTARRRVDGFQVAASTWNRFLAALDKWARWAVAERLIPQLPFRRVERTVMTPQGLAVVSTNAERERDDRSASVSFLPYDEYVVWRDVGLRGHLPAGGPDPAWRGRHGARNALFADLLVGTGMRLSEASSLLVNEIPPLVEGRVCGNLHLAAAVCKRSRARTVFLSRVSCATCTTTCGSSAASW
ncbi:site-specific integrase [Actinoplanes sp. NPDC051411]|uniref:site-specific integrase n=1 Tax=Actinoplanes sp. NPDC051411 TaxID=3155522 RepID=UPI00341CDCF8